MLSGGGARGIAHIGVLKVMEQLRIPVDYIAATSMGAIVGGMYATGMSPAEMEKQITTVSWPTLLSDSPPRRDVGFRTKEEDARFPFAFEIGFRDGQFRTFKGALSGSNLELFLHELTRGVDNIATFDQLPIPFRAIATDMVTGREVVFDRGPIYQAMRASISIPGMFTPAEIDGRILGDGGLVNNLPVDVVRAMGADIVIAVNIGTPLMSREQLSSVLGYTAQTINILTEQNVRAQLVSLRPTDVLISPELGELTFVDFTKAAQFIELGVKAAEGARERLAALSDSPASYVAFQARLLVPIEQTPKSLDFIKLEGTHYANPKVLEDQMETQVGKPFQSLGAGQGSDPLVRARRFRAGRLSPGAGPEPARIDHRCHGEVLGTQLSALRFVAQFRHAGRHGVQRAGGPQAHLDQQPRRGVDQRGRPGQRKSLCDRVLPAADARQFRVRLRARRHSACAAVRIRRKSAGRRIQRAHGNGRTRCGHAAVDVW